MASARCQQLSCRTHDLSGEVPKKTNMVLALSDFVSHTETGLLQISTESESETAKLSDCVKL